MRFRILVAAAMVTLTMTACTGSDTPLPSNDSSPLTTTTSAAPTTVPTAAATPAPTQEPAPASPNTDPSKTIVEVVSALPTAPIEGDNGINLRLMVTGLPSGMTLWLIDKTDKYYVVSHEPITDRDGTYSTFDGPLGSGTETVRLTFVVANRQGADTLGANANRSGDISFDQLPVGLTIVKVVPIDVM